MEDISESCSFAILTNDWRKGLFMEGGSIYITGKLYMCGVDTYTQMTKTKRKKKNQNEIGTFLASFFSIPSADKNACNIRFKLYRYNENVRYD
jgi:hypothetical protein